MLDPDFPHAARLALRFVEDMACLIESSRGDGTESSQQALSTLRSRLGIGTTTALDPDTSHRARAVSDPNDSQEASSDILHPLLQDMVACASEWTVDMAEAGIHTTVHQSDMAVFHASIKVLDRCLNDPHDHRPTQHLTSEVDHLLSSAFEGYYAMSNHAAKTTQALKSARADLAAGDSQRTQILSDFDRARRVWRAQSASCAMTIEEREALIDRQAEEIQSLRNDLARVSWNLSQAHHALATVYAPLVTHAVGLVGTWCGLKG